MRFLTTIPCAIIGAALVLSTASAQVAVLGERVHTVTGPIIENGVVLIDSDGVIEAVGSAAQVAVPEGYALFEAAVITPGLIDGRSTVGLTGMLNGEDQTHDQDMLERSSPIQPELSAVDAYNPLEPLVAYLRSFGITTVHTGHAPGELISGRTAIMKTSGTTVREALVRADVAVAATLDPRALKSGAKAPGTRGKAVAMLRQQLIKAQEYQGKIDAAEDDKPVARDLRLEALAGVLAGEHALLLTVDRAQDIDSALRLADEFGFELWLDSCAEGPLVADRIATAGVPVFLHPAMARPWGEMRNASMRSAADLADAGVTVSMQSGYEGYVPKVRVVLFEAAIYASRGFGRERALEALTITPARLLGVDDRVGSIEVGKDGDLALYDGDPFEYTSHCVGVFIEGELVSSDSR